MDQALHVCLNACKAIELQENRKRELIAVMKPHIQSLQKLGAMDVMVSYMKKDIMGVIENYCKVMEHPEAKQVVVSMLKDVLKLYKGMEKELMDLAECYLSKCDKKQVELIILLTRASLSTIRVLTDKTVQKSFGDIQDVLMKQLQTYYKKLQDGVKHMPSPKTPSPKSAPKSKKTSPKSAKPAKSTRSARSAK